MGGTRGYVNISGMENMTPEEIRARNRETYGARIKEFRIRRGLSKEDLAKILEISPSAVRNWENGQSRPDPEYMYRMFEILQVEPNEFFGFKGLGGILSNDERSIIDNYRKLDESGKANLAIIAQALADKAEEHKIIELKKRIVPVKDIERSLAAGEGADWEDYPEERQALLYRSRDVEQADEVFTVNGESMEPLFHNGDHVLVQYCKEIKNGEIGAFYVPGHGGVIKQALHDRLHSINQAYDDIIPYEGAQVIGRVLCRITKDMIPTPEERMQYEASET